MTNITDFQQDLFSSVGYWWRWKNSLWILFIMCIETFCGLSLYNVVLLGLFQNKCFHVTLFSFLLPSSSVPEYSVSLRTVHSLTQYTEIRNMFLISKWHNFVRKTDDFNLLCAYNKLYWLSQNSAIWRVDILH